MDMVGCRGGGRAVGGGEVGRGTLEGRGKSFFKCVYVHGRDGVEVAGCVRKVPPRLVRRRYDNYTSTGEARRGGGRVGFDLVYMPGFAKKVRMTVRALRYSSK